MDDILTVTLPANGTYDLPDPGDLYTVQQTYVNDGQIIIVLEPMDVRISRDLYDE